MTVKLSELNQMDLTAFTEQLGGVFEHSPWVAGSAWRNRPFRSVDELLERMMFIVLREADEHQVTELIRAHPDLGARIQLSEHSRLEQQGAGLGSLDPQEYEVMTGRNRAYMEKFGFPFILAVRGKSKADILAAMEERLGHAPEEERKEALEQIRRIASFRLQDMIEDDERGGMA